MIYDERHVQVSSPSTSEVCIYVFYYSPFLEVLVPGRHDICAQFRLDVTEVGPFMRQDQQHVGSFAQRQLHNCAPLYLHHNTRHITDQYSTIHILTAM